MQSSLSHNIRIYSCRYDQRLEDWAFHRLLEQLPSEMQARALAFRRWEDAHGYVLGKLMVRSALQEMGYAADLSRIRYSPEDRPYFENGPDFNVSHSGTLVVCIIGPSDRSRVGIDIEEKKSIDIADFREQFTAREWEMIRQDGDPQQIFYRLWTAKEALIKADGRGLQIPLSEVVVGDGGAGTAKIGETTWFLRPYEISPGYICHVAGEREPGAVGVGVLEAEVFLRNIPT